nr:ferredoxin [Salmonella sp. NCTC 7297]
MGRVTLRITGAQLLCQDDHPSLLVALESHNVEVEYQCRAGYCGSWSHPAGRRPGLTGLRSH